MQWCVGVMQNGEGLQQYNTKPFMYRVPPKENQGSWHSSGSDPPEVMNGSHRGFWPILCDREPIRYDQHHGHSMEVWELRWSNPGQDCSMHHGRVGHNCVGLTHQVFVHPICHGYYVWGFVFTGGLPHFPVS